jgi:DNA repair exonuclease SbcCD nuclease subunit
LSELFKKAACFTDIHFGYKNNSREFNNDCEEFIIWFIEKAKAEGAETCIFLGDYHHNRAGVNVSTLNYSVSNLQRLSDAFENVYMIMGNHDLYYREKREIHSLPYANLFENVHLINEGVVEMGGVALVPWLIGDEWRAMKKIKSKYVFGHFELPYFKMNAMVEMPDHGGLKAEHFNGPEYVFSGHFHKRQTSGHVQYLGSPFPHNYADAWDDDRGMMLLEWGGVPQHIDWEDGPRYRTIPLSKLIDKPEEYLHKKTYCRVTLDVPISYEEANFIKETFAEQFQLREISLMPAKKEEHSIDWSQGADIEVENVDKIVYTQLQAVDSDMISSNKLIEIYNKL